MSMNDSQTHKTKAEPVTVSLTDELRARVDREAVRMATEKGKPVSRSLAVRELLERALPAPNDPGEATA